MGIDYTIASVFALAITLASAKALDASIKMKERWWLFRSVPPDEIQKRITIISVKRDISIALTVVNSIIFTIGVVKTYKDVKFDFHLDEIICSHLMFFVAALAVSIMAPVMWKAVVYDS